jgi:KaiC/GvpD/RAD55 family RecA-like ATPase
VHDPNNNVNNGSRKLRLHLLDDPAPPPLRWLVEGFVPDSGLATLAGAPGCGKSMVAAALALAVAEGADWLGRPVRRGGVLYVASEAGASTLRRIRSVTDGYADKPPLALANGAWSLVEDDARATIVAAIDEAATRLGRPVRLVIIDALGSSTRGADENSGKDMGRAFGALLSVVRERNVAIVLIAHTGRNSDNRSVRGHSGMLADVDAHLHVSSDKLGKSRTIDVVKMRDGETGARLSFAIENGKAVAADAAGNAQIPKPKPPRKLPRDAATALKVLTEMTADGPVLEAIWKEALKSAFGDRNDGAMRQAMSNARHTLIERNRIVIEGDYVSVSKLSANVSNGFAADAEERQQNRQRSTPLRGALTLLTPRRLLTTWMIMPATLSPTSAC